ncbi:MAG: isochorismatase family protein [Alphaproteobacteria bacterium]|nr:isochorismatase family protein [Alphaproteobacteria bacterium]
MGRALPSMALRGRATGIRTRCPVTLTGNGRSRSNARRTILAREGRIMAREFEDHCWRDVIDDDLVEIYKSYERDLHVGERPAILAIDLYRNAYLGGDKPVAEANRAHAGSCGENAWKALPPTQKVLAAARAAGVPVIYTTRHVDTRGVNSTNRDNRKLRPDAYDIIDEVKPEDGELVIYKERASAFFGTPLIAHLNKMGMRSIIALGESTSGCVRASVVDAYSHGFHTVVVEECTYDRSMLSHKVNLFDLHHKYADVMHVDDVLAHLDGMKKNVLSA